jgi:hypothetical protein
MKPLRCSEPSVVAYSNRRGTAISNRWLYIGNELPPRFVDLFRIESKIEDMTDNTANFKSALSQASQATTIHVTRMLLE